VTVLGSYRQTLNPRLHFVSPLAVVVRVDLRPQSSVRPPFAAPAVDGTPIMVGARGEYRIVSAVKSVFGTPHVGEAVRRSLKEAVSDSVSRRSKEATLTDGWSIAQEVRDRVTDLTRPFGAGVDCVTVTVQSAVGPMEYFSRSGSEVPRPPLR
jgi:regulator of protease activity HflC (stomatin/prohibitin superfamily)